MAYRQDFASAVEGARKAFNSGKTKPIEFRKQQLTALAKLLDDNEDALCKALHKDMGRVWLNYIIFFFINSKVIPGIHVTPGHALCGPGVYYTTLTYNV